MSPDSPTPGQGHRPQPAKPVGDGPDVEDTAKECPHCHATSVGDVPFCGSCGYDFVTGVEPQEEDEEDPGPRPTTLQSAEPHEAYINPKRDADEIELPTLAEDVALDPGDLPRRPDVPPPTPPSAADEFVAHERGQKLPPSRMENAEWVAEVWVDHAWHAAHGSDQPVPPTGRPEIVPLTTHNIVIGRTNIERGMHPDLDAGTDAGVNVRHAQLTSDGVSWWIEDLDTSNGTYISTVGLPLPEKPIERGLRVRIDEDDRVYLGGWTRLMLRRKA